MRDGNKIHGYDKYDLPRMIAIFNKARWVTEHGSGVVKQTNDSESELGKMIQQAYNAGHIQELATDSKIRKHEMETKLQALENMKPEYRDRWLIEEPDLEKAWRIRQKSKKGGGQ